MQQKVHLSPTLFQTLRFSTELQRALFILSLPIEELSEFVSCEIEKNPLYELPYTKQAEHAVPLSDQSSYTPSIFENLYNEARVAFNTAEDLSLAKILIGCLNEKGYLYKPLEILAEDFSVDIKELTRVQRNIQKLGPLGIGSENTKNFLLFQLIEKNEQNTLLFKIIQNHYEDLLHQRFKEIRRKLKISQEKIQEEIEKNLKQLKLQPLNSSISEKPVWVRPDIAVIEDEGIIKILIDDESVYPVNTSNKYEHLFTSNSLNSKEKSFLIKALTSGNWLIKNLQMRKKTLYEITKHLIETQKNFFLKGTKTEGTTISEVAKKINLSASTISRAVQNKYIQTPFGLYPLKFFFVHTYKKKSSQSTHLVELEKIIQNEDKSNPYTDQQICEKLLKYGITLSRRCISKYRQKLAILSAKQRRRL